MTNDNLFMYRMMNTIIIMTEKGIDVLLSSIFYVEVVLCTILMYLLLDLMLLTLL